MSISRRVLSLAALALGVLAGAVAGAGTVQIPVLRLGQNLTAADQKLLTQAMRQAVGEGKAGATADWSDDSTGHAGRVTVLRVYEQGGMPCSSVEHVFTRGGGDRYVIPFCRQPDGAWKIAF
jgi:surface antigen